MMKDLSIIIVTYKGWNRLEECLQSISAFTGKLFTFEVIIVDNTPDPAEILQIRNKFPGFTYLHNPVNGGYAYGSNIGGGKASGKYILILNPDTIVSENDIAMLLQKSGENGFELNSCRQVNRKGKESIVAGAFPEMKNITGLMRTLSGRKEFMKKGNILFPDWVSGSVMLMSRDYFVNINGLDEDFWMYYEDVDLCKRVSDRGGKVAIYTDITIEHNHGGSSRINPGVTALTKTEVIISRHVYFSKHTKGAGRFFSESFMVINNLITNLLTAIPGVLFFFVPKLFVRTLIFINLIKYYFGALIKWTWVSPRSVNFGKHA